MRKISCSVCGFEGAASETLLLGREPVCRPCAEARAREAQSSNQNLQFGRIIDPTICAQCKTDYGSSELPLIGGAPFCSNCSQGLYNRPYPAWLKFSLAGLLLILPTALWHGVPYFRAGRHLVIAERAMAKGDYANAASHFAQVLEIKPNAQKVILQGAKASLMSGDPVQAGKFLKLREQYESNELFTEVNGTWERALDAYKKANEANKLEDSHQDQEAADLMRQASQEYPQSRSLALAAAGLESSVAFDRKDYDTFLRLSQAALEQAPDSPSVMGSVASAWACKYAVTGDFEFRRQAERLLVQAQELSQGSTEDKASFTEYAERIRYRLETREIIDKKEYDRRFRQKEAKR